jgi:hypothetical protein
MPTAPLFSYDDRFHPAKTRKKRKNRAGYKSPLPTTRFKKISTELMTEDGGQYLKDIQSRYLVVQFFDALSES